MLIFLFFYFFVQSSCRVGLFIVRRMNDLPKNTSKKKRGPTQEIPGFEQEVARIAENVRLLRSVRGWTLEQASEQTGIDPKHLWKLEAAWGRGNITLLTLLKLARGYGCGLHALLSSDQALLREGTEGYGRGEAGLSLVQPREVEKYATCLPLFQLGAVAAHFGGVRVIEPDAWVRMPKEYTLAPGMFVAQCLGRAMAPLIADRAYAVWKSPVATSPIAKIVLIAQEGYMDPDSGGKWTVRRVGGIEFDRLGIKHYRAEALDKGYQTRIFVDELEKPVQLIAEFVDVLSPRP